MIESVSVDAAEIAAAVVPAEYARLLGAPRGRALADEVAAGADAARRWYAQHGHPFVAARRVAVRGVAGDGVSLDDGTVLGGEPLVRRVRAAEAPALAVVAVTAGPEPDAESARLWAERPDAAYFLDRFAAAVAEALVPWAAAWFCRRLGSGGETLLPHLSPGCGGWDLAAQPILMGLLADTPLGPLDMLESGMLTPKNSLLAVAPVSRRPGEAASAADACRACGLSPCAFRRVPFQGAA